MSIAIGEGALEGAGEFKDMVEAKESSRSDERNSSSSLFMRLCLVFLIKAGGDGAE